ncbi:MAG: acetyl-CoA carboxylase biotin carboxyl carrier protein [Chlamydiales bacterium]
MDLKQIEKLMMAMHGSRIKRVAIKQEGFEIEVERECAAPVYREPPLPAPPVQASQPEGRANEPLPPPKEEVGKHEVSSPMVGTFYSASSPEDPPYVKVGDRVDEDSVICIIEAMKVMNEVKAGVKGMVAECLVKNGDPVEFGTKIFRIKTE